MCTMFMPYQLCGSRKYPYSPHRRFFHFKPPSPQNFCSRGVCEDLPSPPEFRLFFTLITEPLGSSKLFYTWKIDSSHSYHQFILLLFSCGHTRYHFTMLCKIYPFADPGELIPYINIKNTAKFPKGLDSSRHVKIFWKTTNFLSLQDMFRQSFCHLQLNEWLQSKLNNK